MNEFDFIRVRDDILQAMYWMSSEGFGDTPALDELARFLAVPAATLAQYVERLVRDRYLAAEEGRYRLTPKGAELGKRTFADEFAGLTGQAHGECDDDCWCHESPEEAARCLDERLQHVHSH